MKQQDTSSTAQNKSFLRRLFEEVARAFSDLTNGN